MHKDKYTTMTFGLITLDLKNRVEALKELEKYMKELSKMFLLYLRKNIGRDMFTYGLIMQSLKSFKHKIMRELMPFLKKFFLR